MRHDNPRKDFILHLEYQVINVSGMPWRMLDYRVKFKYKYPRLPVRQYVLYIGHIKLSMKDFIKEEKLEFGYNLLNIKDIDYEVFIHSSKIEVVLLSILSDFKDHSPEITFEKF